MRTRCGSPTSQLESDVAALEAELVLIQKQVYIAQAAREYRLGKAREVPFALADDAPSLADDAPGSALVRLGTRAAEPTPLESWARLLFGDAQAGSATDPERGPSRPASTAPEDPSAAPPGALCWRHAPAAVTAGARGRHVRRTCWESGPASDD